MKVIVLKRHYYNGKTHIEGDEYEIVKQSDYEILSKIGQIRLSDGQPEVKPMIKVGRGKYKRRDLTAQQ